MRHPNTLADPTTLAAVKAEFNRWSTACDSRRDKARSSWVCRQDEQGEWIETTAHPSIHEAEAARTTQALAAVLALPEVTQLRASPWRDISTAERDGTFILTVAGQCRPCVAHWGTYFGKSRWGADPETFMSKDAFREYWLGSDYYPTDWMPLPE